MKDIAYSEQTLTRSHQVAFLWDKAKVSISISWKNSILRTDLVAKLIFCYLTCRLRQVTDVLNQCQIEQTATYILLCQQLSHSPAFSLCLCLCLVCKLHTLPYCAILKTRGMIHFKCRLHYPARSQYQHTATNVNVTPLCLQGLE